MSEPRRRPPTRIRPVPGVTWRSHLGCGALFGFAAGFLGVLDRAQGWGLPLAAGLAGAVVAALLAAFLGNKFWLRRFR